MKKKKQLVYYICDKTSCAQCVLNCNHTSDVTHAKNFITVAKNVFKEREVNGDSEQAVREFAEKLKERWKAYIERIRKEKWKKKVRKDDFLLSQYAQMIGTLEECIEDIDELVNEVCGE